MDHLPTSLVPCAAQGMGLQQNSETKGVLIGFLHISSGPGLEEAREKGLLSCLPGSSTCLVSQLFVGRKWESWIV